MSKQFVSRKSDLYEVLFHRSYEEKKAVDAVYEFLEEKYPDRVVKSHSSMTHKTRAENERAFICGEKSIMVATSAFGMGIDHKNFDTVKKLLDGT